MYLKNKTWQSRRDFAGIFACPHCGYEHESWGYDDTYFHHDVIPTIKCPKCGKTGGGPVTNPTTPAGIEI